MRLSLFVAIVLITSQSGGAAEQRRDAAAPPARLDDVVYKITVEDAEETRTGTCFPIHAVGLDDNPTVWFLTAAHVVLGGQGQYTNAAGTVKRIGIRRGGGVTFEGDPKSVAVPPNWAQFGLDFALVKVQGFGQPVRVASLVVGSVKRQERFKALGYPGANSAWLQIDGTVLAEPGEIGPYPWYVVSGDLVPGMSGGPVFSGNNVFGIVRGQDVEAGKFVVPVSLARNLLLSTIPDWKDTQFADVGASRTGGLAWDPIPAGGKPTSSSQTVEIPAFVTQREIVVAQANVGCNNVERGQPTVKVPLGPGEKLMAVSAVLKNASNLRASQATATIVDKNQVAVSYSIVGLPQDITTLFNCAGGGHATIAVAATIASTAPTSMRLTEKGTLPMR